MTDPALSPAFHDVLAGLEEQRYTGRPGERFDRCFGCGPAHPAGLRVRCFKTEGGVVSPIVIAPAYDGPPGAAHGGIVAAYLDEVLAAAVVRTTGRVSVTGELTVRYLAPTPTGVPLLGRARLAGDHGRYADAEGHLEVLETGKVVASARGRFFPLEA